MRSPIEDLEPLTSACFAAFSHCAVLMLLPCDRLPFLGFGLVTRVLSWMVRLSE